MGIAILEAQKITYQQFREMEFPDDDTFSYELINGELVKKSAPSPIHQLTLRNVTRIVDSFVLSNKLGEVLFAPVDVFLSDYNVLQPDLLFISEARKGIISKDGILGAPDLVVEIVSPSSVIRDRVEKMKIYQKHQIAEYWLIDPHYRSIEIHQYIAGEGYDLHSWAVGDGEANSFILKGLTLHLQAIFAGINES